jgi:superoxide oxidase
MSDLSVAALKSYDGISKAFHWLTLGLVVAVFALPLAPGLVEGSTALHKSLGMMLMAIMLARLAWRLTQITPSWILGRKSFKQIAVFVVHQGFYGMLIAIPLLGWAYLGYKGQTLEVFGIALPALVAGSDRAMAALLFSLKKYLAYLMLGLIGLHASAALFHHYVKRDSVLRSILPGVRRPQRMFVAPASTPAGAD